MPSDWLPFGVLGRPHGTKGELRLHLHAGGGQGAVNRVLPPRVRLVAEGDSREIGVEGARRTPEGYLVRFEGIADRQSAAALVGQEVHLPREALPALGTAEFYVQDVVGCEAVDTAGCVLGQVRGTFWNGAQDVMVVVDPDGRERLIPVVPAYVLAFDSDQRRLVVTLPDD